LEITNQSVKFYEAHKKGKLRKGKGGSNNRTHMIRLPVCRPGRVPGAVLRVHPYLLPSAMREEKREKKLDIDMYTPTQGEESHLLPSQMLIGGKEGGEGLREGSFKSLLNRP